MDNVALLAENIRRNNCRMVTPIQAAAGQLLASCQWLLAEYSPGFMRRGGMEPADLVDMLEGHGLFPHHIGARDVQPLSRDALLALESQANIRWARSNTLPTAA